MKLLVCDIEGTIIQPCNFPGTEHNSYIWTAIAKALGEDAMREELETQRKWARREYDACRGNPYLQWVNDSIKIHRRFHLKRMEFERIIDRAVYVRGVQEFFRRLDRNAYIPVFVSGGMQNLNRKACRDLHVATEDSYAACEYFFDSDNEIDENLTFMNTSNFHGKRELIDVSLRKYGLGKDDWLFIGDGVNDIEVAKAAPLSIGIDPNKSTKEYWTYVFEDFYNLLGNGRLLQEHGLFSKKPLTDSDQIAPQPVLIAELVEKRLGKIPLQDLEWQAYETYCKDIDYTGATRDKHRFSGILRLLEDGECALQLFEVGGAEQVVSAVLQPFCNAVENMVNVTLALNGYALELSELFYSRSSWANAIKRIDNPNLKQVLNAYRESRNDISHGYHELPLMAARSLAQRSYEMIQRLELIIHPFT